MGEAARPAAAEHHADGLAAQCPREACEVVVAVPTDVVVVVHVARVEPVRGPARRCVPVGVQQDQGAAGVRGGRSRRQEVALGLAAAGIGAGRADQ